MRIEELTTIGILKIHMTLTYSPGEQKHAPFSLKALLSSREGCLEAYCLEHSIEERINLMHLLGEYRYFRAEDRLSRIMGNLVANLMGRIVSVIEARMCDGMPEIAHYADERYWHTYQQIERIATTESLQRLFNKPGNDAKYHNLDLSQILPAAYHSGKLSMSIDHVWGSVEHRLVEESLG